MHLKQLKLAGFKSFVDPTTIPFPSQLVAVVGPNGCGKSNIIDAVRWVMGESSAKNLRGESMVDVIFNGSSDRKAVGQATVELVFDNSLGRLTGQYASYQEISVKRLVNRDGDSFYFLNGTRCRRRDITDVFLGTGAGARGYSIIGQGTISRLVEARPEELRVFLEEAAGISKYKERRRETLTRIQHTRDNLARVADVRDELGKQLQRLERQASAAKRYQALKEEETACKIDIIALKWQALNTEQTALQQTLSLAMVHYEQQQANITSLYSQGIVHRERWENENTALQAMQTEFHQLATAIAILEQTIAQQEREKQRLESDKQQLQADWQTLSLSIREETLRLQEGQLHFITINDAHTDVSMALANKQVAFNEQQAEQKRWQDAWNDSQKALATAVREEQVEQVKLNHLSQQRHDLAIRLEKIQLELQQIEDELIKNKPLLMEDTLPLLQEQARQYQQEHQALKESNDNLRRQLVQLNHQLQEAQGNYHQLSKQEATLKALINAAIGCDEVHDSTGSSWVDFPRLIEAIAVDKEWQNACEIVLGNNLNAYLVDDIESILTLPAMTDFNIGFTVAKKTRLAKGAYPRLSDKIAGTIPVFLPDMDKILAATTLAEACEWLPFIAPEESVITQAGVWIGHGWVKVTVNKQQTDSVLARQQELCYQQELITAIQTKQALLTNERDELLAVMSNTDDKLAVLNDQLLDNREAIHSCEMEIKSQARMLEQSLSAKTRLMIEKDDLCMQLEDKLIAQTDLEESLQRIRLSRQQAEVLQEEVIATKATWENSFRECQQALEKIRTELHQLELQRERQQLIIQQASQTVVRDEIQLQYLAERLEAITEQLLMLETPNTSLIPTLEEKLAQYREMEAVLENKREQLASLVLILDTNESQLKAEEKQAKNAQEAIQQQQLHLQTIVVRASGLLESLAEWSVDIDKAIAAIPLTITLSAREQVLQEVVDTIKRLGAINLAAIDEYNSESARKHYLDDQYHDLTEALTMLESAIEKMDKETKQKLQQTFNDVNLGFQTLFPRLFGGGRAMLELTCDNLLEAGIVVMAQPPGKRNSSIHLLSGGEKAMTAVALVFAIFQLNPSPFCMLDEVDAPLDDVNVGRFCTLVKEMSQFVQFLFISHNKVTMELAEHLIGVTMREPGVSRIVTVDVEQALALTEA